MMPFCATIKLGLEYFADGSSQRCSVRRWALCKSELRAARMTQLHSHDYLTQGQQSQDLPRLRHMAHTSARVSWSVDFSCCK